MLFMYKNAPRTLEEQKDLDSADLLAKVCSMAWDMDT